MLETSRRLLTRRSSGVAPRRAQVVPGRWRKLWPVSSRKSSVRPSRRAFFFERHPLAPRPGGDGGLVAFPGPGRSLARVAGRWTVKPCAFRSRAPSAAARGSAGGSARRAPAGSTPRCASGSSARSRNPPPLHRPPGAGRAAPRRGRPGAGVEARRPPGPRSGAQPAPPLLMQGRRPAADAGTTDTEAAGDGRLRHPPLAQQCCRRQTTFLQLVRSQARRAPLAAAHRHHPRQCRPVGCYPSSVKIIRPE
jgi:hypothetical protein